MIRFFFSIFLVFLLPLEIFASVAIQSVLPNPAGDDTLGEYIELRNTGCASVDISGYSLSDLSGKTYVLPSGTNISSHENRSFPYSETKIALNNSGNESVYLKDMNGTLVDSYNYSGTQGDNVVLTISLTDEVCADPGVTNTGTEIPASAGMTGSTETGSISTGSLDNSGTINPGTVIISTGTLDSTGTTLEVPASAGMTGSTETVSENTGSLISSGSTNTGGIISPYIETGALSPIEMHYSDNDANGKIDTLEITYPHSLTGVVNVDNIFLFSRTGGLSSTKIDTATGYIVSWYLSGNTLILKILEGDLEKTTLHVNNSTTSDLRLKSSSDLGFRSIGGKIPEDFLLTKSFDEYRKAYSRSSTQIPTSAGMTGTGGSAMGTTENGAIGTGGTSTGILDTNNSSSGATSSGISFVFPEIILTLQSPTNATLSGESFICTTSDCRINLTLEPIFSSGFLMKEYKCYFGTGDMLVLDTDCNPNTLYYTRSGTLVIELHEKAHTGNLVTKIFGVEWNVISTASPVNALLPGVPDTGKPVAVMELDNKWKEYYFQDGDDSLICYTMTCSVNFTAEKSYDPEGSKVSFLWIYGQNDISTSKDPGGRKYGFGDHIIILRVIDEAGNYAQIDYHIHVVGPKPKEEKEEKIQKSKKKKEKISASLEGEKKKIKKIKMLFYSPPKIILQGKSGKEIKENFYICEYKKKKLCNMNFSLSGTLKGYEYHWLVDGEEVYTGKNPKAWKLTPGIHEIALLMYHKNSPGISNKETFTIQVVSEKKNPKKAKKPKKPKTKKVKKSKPLTIISETSAGSENGESSSTNPLAFLIFGSGIGLGYLLRRRKKI